MKAKKKKAAPISEPIQIKRGNVVVNVYSGRNRVGKKSYPQYTVVYYLGGTRKKKRFADLAKAKEEAELVATKMVNAEHEVLKLTSLDRAAYVHAMERLKPLKIPLNMAVDDYVDALSLLPSGIRLREAVDFFLRRNPSAYPKRTVQEVADELLQSKEQAGRSDVHIKDLRSRLNRFATTFQAPISDITGRMIQDYLAGLNLQGRTRRNHLRLITSLFKFAVRRRYLPKEALEELEAVDRPEEDPTEIQIFSPREMAEILKLARAEIIPWLAIGAFAGMRNAELQRLDWSEVNLEERFIEVSARKSKTASRRLAPVPDNLAAWLAPYVQESGSVTAYENMSKQIDWLVKDINSARREKGSESVFTWKRNGLRHSFVSYRLATIKDAAQVALECGNSPAMVFRHYRQLVKPSEAEQWFSINPERESNVVVFPKGTKTPSK